MIPVRVKLQGFMPFREEAELKFDAANLWMLCGRNGAGKSTIFDAITFALFGTGRFGGRDVMSYVNQYTQRGDLRQGENRAMSVEFDFDIGNAHYRVKRMYAIAGPYGNLRQNGDYAAHKLEDGVEGPVLLGTNNRAGFESWVQRTIRLNSESFTASVLLQQGQSDALISSTPAIRDEILRRVINLGDYERLHAAVNAVSAEWNAGRHRLRLQMAGLKAQLIASANNAVLNFSLSRSDFSLQETPNLNAREPDWLMDDADRGKLHRLIDRLRKIEMQSTTEVAGLTKLLDTLKFIQTRLVDWQKEQKRRGELLWQRNKYSAILKRATEIEQNFARWTELSLTTRKLEDWITERTNWRAAKVKHRDIVALIGGLRDELQKLRDKLPDAEELLKNIRIAQRQAIENLAGTKANRDILKKRKDELEVANGKPACQVCGKELTEVQRQDQLTQVESELRIANARVTALTAGKVEADAAVTSADATVKAIIQNIASTEKKITRLEGDANTEVVEMRNAETNVARILRELKNAFETCSALQVGDRTYQPANLTSMILAAPDDKLELALESDVFPSDLNIVAVKSEIRRLNNANADNQELNIARQEYNALAERITDNENHIMQYDDEIRKNAGTLEAMLTSSIVTAFDQAIQEITTECNQLDATLAERFEQQAGCPKACVDALVRETESRQATENDTVTKALLVQTELDKTLKMYESLIPQQKESERYAALYTTLTAKLGINGVQSWLRQDAERRIVDHANVTLQRLSNGTLAVHLLPGANQTLDIRVTDHEKNAFDLLPKALSGSQKFRLSVALALGIGQFAGGKTEGGIESVIIDEGFGSLDAEGREQMVAELENLGNILKRIIVVSHQEDMKESFPNRYRIYIDGSTSKAELEVA